MAAAVAFHMQPALAASPIFALDSLDASVGMIDPANFTELRRLPVGKEQDHLSASFSPRDEPTGVRDQLLGPTDGCDGCAGREDGQGFWTQQGRGMQPADGPRLRPLA